MFRILDISGKCILGGGLTLALLAPLHSADAKKKETVLYNFCSQTNCTDGELPQAGLIADSSGNLYGTTFSGGTGSGSGSCIPQTGDDCGTVFKLAPDGTETVLYSFCSQTNCTDGQYPEVGLIMDGSGNLYGTTRNGGFGDGTVFKLAPNGTETVLYSFCSQINCTDGEYPYAGLIADKAGNLYGTTEAGGGANPCESANGDCGTVFKLAPDGTETVLHSFCSQTNCTDGALPEAGLIEDKQGNLYGTTAIGGANSCEDTGNECGTVFKITPDGTETVLRSFCSQTNCTDGENPEAGLIADKAGNLYSTTANGGGSTVCEFGCGTVFKLAPDGTETVLHAFRGYPRDGEVPDAGVILVSGYLYSVTGSGGANDGPYGGGTVFKVKK